MSTATELLKEIYADLEYDSKLPLWLRDKVRDFLAAEPEAEPVAWQGLTSEEWQKIHDKWMDSGFVLSTGDFVKAIEQALKEKNTKPAEPARKPMTEEEMRKGSGEWAHLHNIFEEGIRFAEKHHGIGEDDE